MAAAGTEAGGARDDGYLARVIRVLEVFDSELTALKVSAIAGAAELPLPTAYRIVGDLVSHGLLGRDVDGRIRLGSRLWELANRGSPLEGLREAARSELISVHTATGFHTNFAVLREGTVLVVDRIVADTDLRNRSITAARMSALRSSLGLAMLAHAPYAQLRLAIALELAELPEPSVGERDAFAVAEESAKRELDGVRRRGYAAQRGQQDTNTMGVAAPVLGERGLAVASIGVIMPVDTTHAAELAAAERLRHVAGRIADRIDQGQAGGAVSRPATRG
ncbi:IclR family transcriptional regulator [Pseudoclavibacter endophyticus]|uniref:Helix-turn-helix domain-containing protein n=1 Tax=Pseudoclavibacter endophyticus TaxID=1778590 RepID=A0A6H9WCG1_9MICO|nr:helix-turn-helix domain-containing protein [Pseudoclavibacter endophyticus]KAB1648373.1 helix-turn-helix domain-containing protein [Pseudoclavibacter endophyticus]GGA72147.1 IclR family transcriptional regulator [Pseudoclavibacter endophyticus]